MASKIIGLSMVASPLIDVSLDVLRLIVHRRHHAGLERPLPEELGLLLAGVRPGSALHGLSQRLQRFR